MKLRYAMALLPFALAACDEQAMQDIRMPWDKPEVAAPAAPVDPTAIAGNQKHSRNPFTSRFRSPCSCRSP